MPRGHVEITNIHIQKVQILVNALLVQGVFVHQIELLIPYLEILVL